MPGRLMSLVALPILSEKHRVLVMHLRLLLLIKLLYIIFDFILTDLVRAELFQVEVLHDEVLRISHVI